ncbi:MAG: hypothetical protein KC503_12505, partial [Myxococcales bacterium]|nr:hypothetical protein [Myxococcales bacterium]
ACGSDGLDVAAEVAAARASNDNASAGLAARPELFAKPRLVLNSGRYYFASAAGLGNAHILANGAVRIYVDGDMQFVGNERFQMTEGSTVDVYVAGNVASVGNVEVGQRYHPAAFRLYVGGRDTVTIRHLGNKRFRGAIYAPRANIEVAGNVTFEGALFANTISNAGNLILTFAQPSHSREGHRCVPPPSTSPGPLSPPDGTPGGGNPDFNDNQPPGGTPGGNTPGNDFNDNQPRGDTPGNGAPGSGGKPGADFNDDQPLGDPPPNKDGLPDPADLPRVM